MHKLKAAYAYVENDLNALLFFRVPVWSEHLAQIQQALSDGAASVKESRGTGWILTLDQPLPNMRFPWYRVEFRKEQNAE